MKFFEISSVIACAALLLVSCTTSTEGRPFGVGLPTTAAIVHETGGDIERQPPPDWTLKGNVTLKADEHFDFPAYFPVDSFEFLLTFEYELYGEELEEWNELAHDDEEPVDTIEFEFQSDADGNFEIVSQPDETDVLDNVSPDEGQWSLLITSFYHPSIHLYRKELETNSKVEVQDRRARFKSIVVTREDVLGDHHLLFGRMLDSEGNPLSNSSVIYLACFVGDTKEDCRIATDGQGRFVVGSSLEDDDPCVQEDADLLWALQYAYRLRDYEPEDSYQHIEAPERNGVLHDFGDIAIEGCVVRLSVEDNAPPDPNKRVLYEKHATPGFLQYRILCTSFLLRLRFDVPLDGREVCAWIPEGVYSTRIIGGLHHHLDGRNAISVPDRGVMRVRVPKYVEHFVPVEVVNGAEAEILYNRWTVFRSDTLVRRGDTRGRHFGIPLREGERAEILVSVKGYHPVRHTVRFGDGLKKVVVDRRHGSGQVELELPAPPDGLTWEQIDPRLRFEWEGGFLTENLFTQDDELRTKFEISYDGAVTLTILAGNDYGWPGRRVIAPVEFEVSDEKTAIVSLPPALKSRFRYRVKKYASTKVICGGDEGATIHATLVDETGSELRSHDTVNEYLPAGYAVGVRDGEKVLPIAFEQPDHDDATVQSQIDFPVRLILDATAFVDGLGDDLYATLASQGARARCHRLINDSAVKLWAPPGKATLTIRHGGPFGLEVYRIPVELTDGEVVHHTAAPSSDLRIVTFVQSEEGSTWWQCTVYRVAKSGRIHDQTQVSKRDSTHLLPRGKYFALPGARYPDQSRFEFEVGDGDRQTVKLPVFGAEREQGTLELKFDQPGGVLRHMVVDRAPVRGSDEFRRSRWFSRDGEKYWEGPGARMLEDGVRIYEFPMNMDYVVYGYLEFTRQGRPEYWMIKPVRVKLEMGGQVVSTELEPARLIEPFDYGDIYSDSWCPGYRLLLPRVSQPAPQEENGASSLGSTWHTILPVGEHDLSAYQEDGMPVTWEVSVEVDDEVVTVPNEIKEELATAAGD